MAKRIPGKEEFSETLRYFTRRIAQTRVQLHLSIWASVQELLSLNFDEIVLATGVVPQRAGIPGTDAYCPSAPDSRAS